MQYRRARDRNFQPSRRAQILENAAAHRAAKETLSAILRGEPAPPRPRRREPGEVVEDIRSVMVRLSDLLAELV